MTIDTRAGKLLAWEIESGRPLPMGIPEILAAEDAGLIVDLDTGEILTDVTVSSTVLGQAWCVLCDMEVAA